MGMKESWGVEPSGAGGNASVRQHAPFGLDFTRNGCPTLEPWVREMANRVPSEGHRRGTWGPRKPSLGGRSGGEGHADGASEGWKSGLSAPDSSLIECPMSHCKPASRSYIYRVVLACLPSVGRSQLRAPWRVGAR